MFSIFLFIFFLTVTQHTPPLTPSYPLPPPPQTDSRSRNKHTPSSPHTFTWLSFLATLKPSFHSHLSTVSRN